MSTHLKHQQFYDFLGAIMTGVIIGKLKDIAWATSVGSLLIIWYLFDISQRISLLFGHQMYQFDWQWLYILVDITTLIYFIYVKLKPLVTNIFYKMNWTYLIPWYISYTFVDIFVPPLYQPNSTWFHVLFISLSLQTITVIAWNEILRHDMKLKLLFTW